MLVKHSDDCMCMACVTKRDVAPELRCKTYVSLNNASIYSVEYVKKDTTGEWLVGYSLTSAKGVNFFEVPVWMWNKVSQS